MITAEQINELSTIIDYLNHAESLYDKDLSNNVEDITLLSKALSTVKVSKIKSLMNNQSNKAKKVEAAPCKMDPDSVICLFKNSESDYIIKTHTLSQLKEMYIAVYGENPLSQYTKKDIVSSINKMIQQINRATGFKELDNKIQ